MVGIIDYFSSAVVFVHLAALSHILAMLTRKELLLRALLLLGTSFYILYYYFITSAPLWEAMATSALIGSANLIVIYRIIRERSTLGMSGEMLSLYRSFPNFNPGQFRRMMALAEIVTLTDRSVLLRQGVAPAYLYLTTSDGFALQRDHNTAPLGPGNFLGEISFLLDGTATATVTAEPQSTFVAWDLGKLKHMMESSPQMANAITVLLSKDIARKLAISFPTTPSALPQTMT